MDYRVEIFSTEVEAINRIVNLKTEGVSGEEMYVMAKDHEMIRRLSHIRSLHTHTKDDDTFWKRIKGFFKGKEHVGDMWDRLGVSAQLASAYEDAVEHGKILLVLEKPDPIIGEQWKEYVVPDIEYYSDSTDGSPEQYEHASDVPPELINDVFPTEIAEDLNLDQSSWFTGNTDELPIKDDFK